jgi:proteic killer suppression protein
MIAPRVPIECRGNEPLKDATMKTTCTQNLLVAAPGNRLEALQGSRAGPYSIRVNDQFRLCFRWTAAGPEDVEIVDYH